MRVFPGSCRAARAGADARPPEAAPCSSATGTVKVNRLPRPTPSLSARIRPPCASTSPLQMVRPSPAPASPRSRVPPAGAAYLRNRCDSRSGGKPRPLSLTEIATCTPSRLASIRMGDDSGEYLAALDRRLPRTWTMRARSAITRGRSSGRSMLRSCLPAPVTNVLRAWSINEVTSTGSGDTDSVPVTMRPWSSSSPIMPRMRSAWSSMTRKNCSISAGSGAGEAPRTVAVEPLIEISGVRSSWLTMPRNSARMRSISSSGSRSCSVTTTLRTVPSSAWIGVELTRVVTLRPSGTESVISSARTLSPAPNSCASGNSVKATSRPSAR